MPASVFDSVGASAPATDLGALPTVLTGQPVLKSAGKPEVLFVGAEYCPFCAAERWPLIVALSRFGHFTGFKNMQSAQLSVFPDTQTFSFVGSTYTSRYLAFTGVELYSDAVDAHGAFARIATLTPVQTALVARYGSGRPTATGHLSLRRHRQPHGHRRPPDSARRSWSSSPRPAIAGALTRPATRSPRPSWPRPTS